MTEADIGMTEHRSKNTLGRSVPIKTKTDVEEDGTSEDGSPRPVCTRNFHLKSEVKQTFCLLTQSTARVRYGLIPIDVLQ